MRLLTADDKGELSLISVDDGEGPPYAILSHTWGSEEDEVTFEDLQDNTARGKKGYLKLDFCREQAQKDGLRHFWVDTCCIKKTDSSELMESIASMFRWYERADKCYVFLADVDTLDGDRESAARSLKKAFADSRWFTRGWTLQELLAPKHVEFFSRHRDYLGDKKTLEREIHDITSIPIAALHGVPLSTFDVGERMQWAAKRNTKKGEDQAYSLMGILGVSFAPLYGEGRNKAMHRLKDEVAREFRSQLYATAPPAGERTTSKHESDDKSKPTSLPMTPDELKGHRQKLLASLRFDSMDDRRHNIKDGHPATCKWLLEHFDYQNWKGSRERRRSSPFRRVYQSRKDSREEDEKESNDDERLPFLWINGKPGAGKSTLMKFAHASSVEAKSQDEIIISFFFNARGDELGKSTVGMYRALLYQLLTQAEDLQVILDPESTFFQKNSPSSIGTIETLCELFTDAVSKLGSRRLYCFVDALDESHDDQVQEMVEFFESLSTSSTESSRRLRVCFASRHYPTIYIRYGRKLIIEEEPGHKEDMARYVKTHLRAGEGAYVDEVRMQIQRKANGVFMWAVLVVNILNKEFSRGSIFAVTKRLEEIPPKLNDLFRDMLRRDNQRLDEFLLCLQWILFAQRPLTREEFYFAMAVGLGYELDALTTGSEEDMGHYVFSASKGLAEVTKSETSVPVVQFIHESVRDFLETDDGLQELWPELGGDFRGLSHDRLKGCCHRYLEVDVSVHVPSGSLPKALSDDGARLRQALMTGFPFLTYATQYMFVHANEAVSSIPQGPFLETLRLEVWIGKANMLQMDDDDRYTPGASILYVLAATNCSKLIRSISPDKAVLGVQREKEQYRYPLFIAIAKTNWEAVGALLRLEGRIHIDNGFGLTQCLGPRFFEKDHTPLLWALENRNAAIAEALLSSEDIDLNETNCGGQTALCLAAESGNTAIVDVLLSIGANVEATDHSGRTALILAARVNRTRIVESLLDHGADPEVRDAWKETALTLAARRGHHETVEVLLSRGADVRGADGWGRTALYLARAGGYTATAVLLESYEGLDSHSVQMRDLTDMYTRRVRKRQRSLQDSLSPLASRNIDRRKTRRIW